MPKQPSRGMVQLAIEIPDELDARLRERCERLNLKKSDEVRLAIRRHLDHPPPDTAPPFPDIPTAPPRRRTGRKMPGKPERPRKDAAS